MSTAAGRKYKVPSGHCITDTILTQLLLLQQQTKSKTALLTDSKIDTPAPEGSQAASGPWHHWLHCAAPAHQTSLSPFPVRIMPHVSNKGVPRSNGLYFNPCAQQMSAWMLQYQAGLLAATSSPVAVAGLRLH